MPRCITDHDQKQNTFWYPYAEPIRQFLLPPQKKIACVCTVIPHLYSCRYHPNPFRFEAVIIEKFSATPAPQSECYRLFKPVTIRTSPNLTISSDANPCPCRCSCGFSLTLITEQFISRTVMSQTEWTEEILHCWLLTDEIQYCWLAFQCLWDVLLTLMVPYQYSLYFKGYCVSPCGL